MSTSFKIQSVVLKIKGVVSDGRISTATLAVLADEKTPRSIHAAKELMKARLELEFQEVHSAYTTTVKERKQSQVIKRRLY